MQPLYCDVWFEGIGFRALGIGLKVDGVGFSGSWLQVVGLS